MSLERRIFKHANSSPRILQELLLNIFVGEFMAPSNEVWIISPWISNIDIIDNRNGGFDSINPDWRDKNVRLDDVLLHLLVSGSSTILVANEENHSDEFFEVLRVKAADKGLSSGLKLIRRKSLHTKGIFTDAGALTGSMNITYRGVNINDERLVYEISKTAIQQNLLECRNFLEDYKVV